MYNSVIRQAENYLDAGLHFLEYGTSGIFYDVIIFLMYVKWNQCKHRILFIV